jgi:hypothetical protein
VQNIPTESLVVIQVGCYAIFHPKYSKRATARPAKGSVISTSSVRSINNENRPLWTISSKHPPKHLVSQSRLGPGPLRPALMSRARANHPSKRQETNRWTSHQKATISMRATFYMLERGQLPAKKIGNKWVSSRRALRRHLAIEA